MAAAAAAGQRLGAFCGVSQGPKYVIQSDQSHAGNDMAMRCDCQIKVVSRMFGHLWFARLKWNLCEFSHINELLQSLDFSTIQWVILYLLRCLLVDLKVLSESQNVVVWACVRSRHYLRSWTWLGTSPSRPSSWKKWTLMNSPQPEQFNNFYFWNSFRIVPVLNCVLIS